MTFTDFNFKDNLQKAIDDCGFKEPSPIQQEAIPTILEGHDVVGQAHTGTGKTAAFGLPIINMLELSGKVETLVIVPTRELAMQVSDELYKFGRFFGIRTATVFGGTSYSRQIKHVENSSMIVATPGRLLDLLKDNKIDIAPRFVVLDEADEMLDMGFLDDIKEIFTYMPSDRQTLMFSATMPKPIKELAERILHKPKFVTITQKEITNENISQHFYVMEEYERDDALVRLLDFKNPEKSIIFCRMKKEVDRLSTTLISMGYSAKGLHGDMEQRQREEVIKSFKKGNLEILIATDVAARGLDVNDVSHVFNYHIPFDSESYVHRIGRTGRAGKKGIAVTLLTPSEFRSLTRIQKDTKGKLQAKVIPSIGEVKTKKKDSLINAIAEQETSSNSYDIIERLKEEFDLSTISFKLVSMLEDFTKIQGKDKIGKDKNTIDRLLKSFSQQADDGKRRKNFKNNRRGGNNYRKDYKSKNNNSGNSGNRDYKRKKRKD